MAGSKRERELARAKYERQQARREQRAGRQRRTQRIIAVVVVVGLVIGSVAWAVLATRSSGDTVVQPTPSIDPSAFASLVASAEAAARDAEGATPSASPTDIGSTASEPVEEPALLDCTAPGDLRANDLAFDSAPTDRTGSALELATNCGPIVIELDPAAPLTLSSMVFLAEEGFYDRTSCHRLTTAGIFVLQCGDPAGNGTGGPGYALPDENLPADGDANYPAGTVAMANAGPGTAGSQFFLVYDDTTLPGDYTIIGTMTEGLDMVREVASVGTVDGSPDGQPRQPLFIESATVRP